MYVSDTTAAIVHRMEFPQSSNTYIESSLLFGSPFFSAVCFLLILIHTTTAQLKSQPEIGNLPRKSDWK